MASTRRKAAAAGLAVIGIAGLSLAAAAQLNITSDQLGAGAIAVGSCDDSGVEVTYTTALASGAYEVDELTVADIDANCDGQTMKVALDGVEIYSATVATTSVDIDVTGVSARDVEDLAIVITGAAS